MFRDSPRLPAISFFDRPACQCVKISQISITSNVLLAIGPPSLDEGMILTSDDQVHPDTHVLTMVNNVIGVVNYGVCCEFRDGVTQGEG